MNLKENRALLFNIQRFSIHDGPGIRTTLFFKGCPLRCIWCQNPESYIFQPEIAYNEQACTADGHCIDTCPEGALGRDGKLIIDKKRCKGCGLCVKSCSTKALQLYGQWWDPESLMEEVLRDRDFYEDSGGGITLSGGEPLMQSVFLQDFVPLLKNQGIGITLQTCGHFSWMLAQPFISDIERIYFDLKHHHSQSHYRLTGQNNRKILENLRKLMDLSLSLTVRIPLIPEVNDSDRDIEMFCLLLHDYAIKSVVLLPYHNLGERKFTQLQLEHQPFMKKKDTSEKRERIRKSFSQGGIHATFEL